MAQNQPATRSDDYGFPDTLPEDTAAKLKGAQTMVTLDGKIAEGGWEASDGTLVIQRKIRNAIKTAAYDIETLQKI
ncbi:MAG: hypothetical protein ABIH78_01695 [Candidatus Peregrinibacteria bacterium]